jgi:cellulose biosynthesis protein BcsQ
MSGKIIAVANMKGGVGKTATVVGLAEALAASGNSVLVIDLDAQANASICIAGDTMLADLMRRQCTIDAFISDFLHNGSSITFDDCIRSNVSNVTHLGNQLPLSLLASSPALRDLEHKLVHVLTRKNTSWEQIVDALWALMKLQLQRTKKHFDYVIIDCAPGISVLTEVSVRLADLVIVPTIPDFLSTFGLDAFCTSMWERSLGSAKAKTPKRPPHVLATRCRQVRIHQKTIDHLRTTAEAGKAPFWMFKTTIPEAVAIADALGQINQYPPFASKWTPAIVGRLNDLTTEIQDRLNGDKS